MSMPTSKISKSKSFATHIECIEEIHDPRNSGTENKMHWPLDRYFEEDRSTIRDLFGAQSFSILRSAAVSILQNNQKKIPYTGMSRKRQAVNRQPNLIFKILLN